MRPLLFLVVGIVLTACSRPHDVPLPKDLKGTASLDSSVQQLTPDERELLGGYLTRHSTGVKSSAAANDRTGIPDGMTIGTAIGDQRAYEASRSAEIAKEKALKEKLKAEQDAAIAQMRDAVTVTLVSKRIRPEYGMSGRLMDEHLVVTFGYKNNTDRDIAGVKGYVSVKDLFGDELSGFLISNDQTIKSGASSTWTGSRSVKYSTGNNQDLKLADLPDDKFKLDWQPRVIVFKDGTQLSAPK